jgi:hypothetical protein
MKYYRFKQIQRITLFGHDDLLKDDTSSFKKTSKLTSSGNDTKILRFNINKIANLQLSQNCKLCIEALYLPIATVASHSNGGPAKIRMNNLNTNSYDTENNGFHSTLIFTNDDGIEHFTNPSPEQLYNFSIDQHFLKNGYIELEISYPNKSLDNESFLRFFISFVIYDVNEETLILKDTPEVDLVNFKSHYNTNNGRIPK